ncbi:hypothetical protein [Haloarcula laminariae]|uniref:hypothetical protein n=1 Tax=Haloarcula laminariae TaxID=2961577 RepID=UPI0021C936D5|nr:hypothetical protein [Halomicroarcula laminariae]
MTENGTETESGTTYAAQLSPTVRLVSAEIVTTSSETTDDGNDQRTATIQLTLEADTPSLVTTSDVFGAVSSAGGNGIVQAEQTERTIPSGTSTAEVSVGGFKGVVGVGIGVPNGTPTIVRRSLPSSGESGPWEPTGSAAGWAGGVSVTTVMGILAAYRVKNSDPDEPETVE